MGDTKRFRLLAEFIERNYPNIDTVLDVAGGSNGYLASELRKRDYTVRTIDPCSRDIADFFTLDKLRDLEKEQKQKFDLIVGVHPDGATREICRAAKTHDIVIVPCCNMWTEKEPNIYRLIQNYLRTNRIEYALLMLPMRGRNIVYYTKNYNRGRK